LPQHRIILFGTGVLFSTAVLDHLLAYGLKPVALVLPGFAPSILKGLGEIPVDRGGKDNLFVSAAKRLSIPLIYLPESSQTSEVQTITEFKADFLLIACWPYLLASEIVNAVDKAALNLHPSLLPDYRGADPVNVQLDCREHNLGVSLHLLSREFDCGDIIGQVGLELGNQVPGRELIETQAARLGTQLFAQAIENFGGPDWEPRPQRL
jgi:methionyl-tRNA formyltransferase